MKVLRKMVKQDMENLLVLHFRGAKKIQLVISLY